MLQNYQSYLSFLDSRLSSFFEDQKPYIFCKKGCAKCCKNAQFPYSVPEVKYLLNGLSTLDESVQNKVENNLKKTLEAKNKFKGKKFLHDCPFLIDYACCVYDYRGVFCRAFGLMTIVEENKVKTPFCCFKGLNYSNVMNLSKKTISVRKFKKLNAKEEPLAHNVRYRYLTGEEFEQQYNIIFGEKKPLIEWFL